MKNLLRPVTVFLILAAIVSMSFIVSAEDKNKEHPADAKSKQGSIQAVPGMVVVKLKSFVGFTNTGTTLGVGGIDVVLNRIGATQIQAFKSPAQGSYATKETDVVGLARIMKIKYSHSDDPYQIARELSTFPEVEYAEPYYVFPLMHTPNDPMVAQQWALTMMGMATAWDVTKGSSDVVIGDVDTGVDYTHEDLAANIWNNPGETGTDNQGNDKRTNGIDDDSNGKIDDWRGWDFIGSGSASSPLPDNDPMDGTLGHGTSTSGCAAAATNNSIGIAGIAYNCKVLPVKSAADATSGISGYEPIVYAADMGCKVINCSWGGTGEFVQALQDVIDYAYNKGALVVASAGNDGLDNDKSPHWPSSFNHVLSVSSIEASGASSDWASYGGTINVYAPGADVYTTKKGGGYEAVTGTSFSSPLTAGVAALVFSQHPDWTPDQVAKQIRVTSSKFAVTRDPKYYGRVNAANALSVNQTLADLPGVNIRTATVATSSGSRFTTGGQTGTISLEIENLLAPTSANAQITITSIDSIFTLDKTSVTLGALATKASTPLVLSARMIDNPTLSEGDALIRLQVNDGSYVDYLYVRVPVYISDAWHTALTADIPAFTSVSATDGMSAWFTADVYVTSTTTLDYCFRTTDAGTSWYNATGTGFPSGSGVYCVEGVTSATALVGTGPSSGAAAIYRTTNGGQTWNTCSVSSMTPFVNWIHMFDAQNGIFQGDPKSSRWGIGTTTDGGKTWTALSTPLTAGSSSEAGWNNSYDFIGQTGWFGTNNRRIYKTTDGGQTWTSYATPDTNSMNISFRDENTGAICFSYANGKGGYGIGMTSDGGATWSMLKSIKITSSGQVMMERGGRRMWFVTNGNVFMSTDAGTTWNAQAHPGSFSPITAGDMISTTTTTVGYLAGYDIFSFSSPWDKLVGVDNTPPATVFSCAINNVYPQPSSNGWTTVSFTVPAASQTTMAVYDLTGRLVRNVLAATLAAGTHSASVDLGGLAPGSYFLRLNAGNETVTRQLIVR
jgi:subtilisin family serine protease/photosystem II stability/assembly factor-like uncharacterized protein